MKSRRVGNETSRPAWAGFALAALLMTSAPSRSPVFAQGPRPNVILIVSDDHATEAFGAYGNPKARTPRLDELASRGVLFTRAYANAPEGKGSRLSILTGRPPHGFGVTQRFSWLDREQLTLAHLVSYYEYRTRAFGLLDFQIKRTHGFFRVFTYANINGPFYDRASRRLPDPVDKNIRLQTAWMPYNSPARLWLNASNLPMGAQADAMPGFIFAKAAADFVREAKDSDRPFFIYLSLPDPHAPFAYPVELAGMFDAADFEPPELGPDDAPDVPLVFRNLTREEKQNIMAAYYTSTAFLDFCVGVVIDALRETGQEEDTVVIYASNLGYSLGHHGWFEKQCFFEPVVNTPLVISWPGRFEGGRVTDAMVELSDIMPTIAGILEVRPPPWVDGHNLVPVLEGRTDRARDFVFSEYLENEEAMVRDERYKLIYTSGKRERTDRLQSDAKLPRRKVRLYDLQNDPDEFFNLAGDPAHGPRIAAMKQRMIDRFSMSDPAGTGLGEGASLDDHLDVFLVPRELWRAAVLLPLE